MTFVNRKADYVEGNLKTIKRLANDLSEKQIYHLHELIWYGGFKAVRGSIIQAIRSGYDHRIFESEEEYQRIKKRCSEKTWACLILWTIWELYYSPLMIEIGPVDKYHPFFAVELGAHFFMAHDLVIDYWPFEGYRDPFVGQKDAVEMHCYTPIRPERM